MTDPAAEYIAAFRRHAACLAGPDQELVDHVGVVGYLGVPERPEARLLVTDDRALPLLADRLPSVPSGTIRVLAPATGCRALLDRADGWGRDDTTGMVRPELATLADPSPADGFTIRPVHRPGDEPAGGVPLHLAAAACLEAQPDDEAAPPLERFLAYLTALPGNISFFAAVDASGTVRATSASDATDHDARVFFVSTHPSCRGLGLGTAMTALALRDAVRRGARHASLDSSDAGMGIYMRLGFVPIGPIAVYHR